jgi:hypothetical protein
MCAYHFRNSPAIQPGNSAQQSSPAIQLGNPARQFSSAIQPGNSAQKSSIGRAASQPALALRCDGWCFRNGGHGHHPGKGAIG